MSSRLRRALPYVIAILSSILVFTRVIESFDFFEKVNDLPEFYSVSWCLWHGKAGLIYDLKAFAEAQHALFPGMNERFLGFFMPPPAVLFFAPLYLVPKAILPLSWFCINFVALIGVFVVLGKLFDLSKPQLIGLWAVVLMFGPVFETFRIGQLGVLLLLDFVLALFFIKGNREIPAALALSFFIAKPQLLIPHMVFLLAAGRKRLFAWTACFCLIWTVASFLVVGVSAWHMYGNIMSQLSHPWHPISFANTPTICGQVMRFPYSQARLVINFAIIVALFAWFCLAAMGSRFKERTDWNEAFTLAVMPVAAITCLYLQDYDFVLLIPALVLFVRNGLYKQFPTPAMLVCIILWMIPMLPFYLFVRYELLLKGCVVNPLLFPFGVAAYLTSVSIWRLRLACAANVQ